MKNKLKLVQLLSLVGIDLNDYKIHYVIDILRKDLPLDDFFVGNFKIYQETQTKKNFIKLHISSLIHLNKIAWLFACIWKKLEIYDKKYRTSLRTTSINIDFTSSIFIK